MATGKMQTLKILAIGFNLLLILLFGTYFISRGVPTNLILISSATLWLVTPVVNLYFISKVSDS
jgi:hypothetical protein